MQAVSEPSASLSKSANHPDSLCNAPEPVMLARSRPVFKVATRRPARISRATIMASSANVAFTAVVKGDPEKQQLQDCPFSHRMLLTLQNKGIPYKTELIDISKPRPQWLQDASGGKVPVLQEGDKNLSDSDKIVEEIEKRFPEPSMKSDAPADLIAKVFPAFRQYLQSKPEEQDEKQRALLAELKPINDYLAQQGKGPLFGGKKMDATDAAFAPRLYHIMVALPHYKGFDVPAELTALWHYIAYIQMLPAWQAVDYGSEMIIQGWANH